MTALNPLEGIFAWAEFLIERDQIKLDSKGVTFDFYGNEEESYLVIELYTSDTSVIQYTLDATNKMKSLEKIFLLLQKMNFNGEKLLEYISSLSYSESEIGDIAQIGDLDIIKKLISS
ncbi:hypothetical protein [Marinibactrum halimedae]|uniref:Uncharacterized protein n=1 Tax=Marinibactrum halimedae TaxID=1444977 RepID=A0AA37TBH3_9GAMM|nr:hypothetical protein [Marinibactrum halimedae]MCD9458347.1 hypothetical protein [Marinibactrum halimedae]GLS27025.1 hypothetical protein GCM10007877_27440 [Marinibactrum halimedae]